MNISGVHNCFNTAILSGNFMDVKLEMAVLALMGYKHYIHVMAKVLIFVTQK
jgi:hypothetical protein